MANPAEKAALKGKGFLSNKDGCFSARVVTENGVLTSEQMKTLCEASEFYANGKISLTSRLSVEISGIPIESIDKFCEYIKKADLYTGGTGAKVRPVVACKGTVCTFGLIDTQGIASEIHKRFYEGYRDVKLPHKFKIGVGGCPNNCVKPDLNDFGIVGRLSPILDKSACHGCEKCIVEASCSSKAAVVKDKIIDIDREKCISCGHCANKCPFNAVTAKEAKYKIYIGGRWGKSYRIGSPLSKLVNKQEALDIIEKALLLYIKMGEPGERFGNMVDRIGLEKVEESLLHDDI